MRLRIPLVSRYDSVHDNACHKKINGRIWRCLQGTKYEKRHDKDQHNGFCYTLPFPWEGDIEEGDEKAIVFTAVEREMLGHIASHLKENPQLDIGQMSFEVGDMEIQDPDVGPPGNRGVITTKTGVQCRIPPWKLDEYGIENEKARNGESDTSVFWKPKHTLDPFVTQITGNLDWKYRLFNDDVTTSPNELSYPLFNGWNIEKEYSIPLQVSEGREEPVVLTKWQFPYEVRDETHREILNFALDVGLGERNSLGLGSLFVHS